MQKRWFNLAIIITGIVALATMLILMYNNIEAINDYVWKQTISDTAGIIACTFLSLVGLALMILAIIKIAAYCERVKKAKAEKREAELKRINRQNLKDSLLELSAKFLAFDYIRLKENNYATELSAVHFEAFYELIKSGKGLSVENLGEICGRIIHTHCHLGRDFLNVIADECLKNDCPDYLFVTNNMLPNKLPLLFLNCSKKKEAVAAYLASKTAPDFIRSFLFNKIKREFRINTLTGILDILAFSYEKTWHEENLEELIKHMQSLLSFAAECLPKIKKREDAEKLDITISLLVSNLNTKGIDVTDPKRWF